MQHRRLFRTGHSVALTIPAHYLRDLNWDAGDLITIHTVAECSLSLTLSPPRAPASQRQPSRATPRRRGMIKP